MHFAKIYSNFGTQLETSERHVLFGSDKTQLSLLCVYFILQDQSIIYL